MFLLSTVLGIVSFSRQLKKTEEKGRPLRASVKEERTGEKVM